jgi:hypothetical protein
VEDYAVSKRKPFIPDFSNTKKQNAKPGVPVANSQKAAAPQPKAKPMPMPVKSSGHRGGSA